MAATARPGPGQSRELGDKPHQVLDIDARNSGFGPSATGGAVART